MSYSNITVVTAQGTFGYQPSDPFVPISYNTLDLIQDIPHNAQLEVERIFSIDRNGDTNAIPNFLNDTNVAVVDKQRVFIIPTDRITYNITTKQITDVLLPSSSVDVFNYTFTYISGPNVGQQGSIAVPQLRLGDNIIIRRKTVSNTPLVLWTAGSKLTTAQLNLNTTQLLFLAQELNNKITITSVSTEQILDNAITTPKILNGAVTSDKLFDLGGPKRLLGSGNVTANADGLYDVQEITLGNGFYWDENSTVLEVADIETGTKGDINVIVPRTNWRIVDNAVTYAKLQDVTASRLLGRGSSGNGDPQELTLANNLTISGTQLAVTTPLTDGNKGDVDVSNNGTVFNLTSGSVNTNELVNNAVTYAKMQQMVTADRVLGTTSASATPQEVQVNTAMLAAAAVTNAKLAANAVDADNIQSNAVTTEKIQNNAVTYEKMRTVGTANRVLGSTSANGAVSEVQVATDMLANNAVSFAKMQQVATNTLLGRAASGTGNVELIAITAAGRELIDENSVADMRQYLQLGTAATQNTSAFATAVHTHGNLSSDGKIGSTSGLPLITGTSGTVQTGSFGSGSGTFCAGDDARLSDARTPTAHGHTIAEITNLQSTLEGKAASSHTHVIGNVTGLQDALNAKLDTTGTLPLANITGAGTAADKDVPSSGDASNTQVVLGNDTRLTNARTPTSHNHAASDINSGTLGIARGGTGVSSTPTNGQLLIGNGSGYSLATLVAGSSNITITNGSGTITIDAATEAAEVSAILQPGTYGDIVVTSGGELNIVSGSIISADLANDAVTFDKIQNIATDRLLGRSSAGSGNVEEITLTAAGRNLLDDADAAAQRTTLGLGTAATQASTAFAAASHTHGNITNAGAIGGTANLPIITTTSGVLTTGAFGTAANTFCQGNDVRLSDARTPLAHTHGNISNAGAIGTAANLPIITTTNGVLTAGSFGSTANTFCQGNDSRLSDTRTPTDNTVSIAKIQNSAVTADKLASNAVTSIKIDNLSVTTEKLANGAVTSDKLDNNAVTYAKLPAITTANRVLGATAAGIVSEVQINSGMIINSSITTEKIADGDVTAAKLDSGAALANIGSLGITDMYLAADSVTTAKILNLNVTTGKLANNAVTYGKMQVVAGANRLLGSTSAGGAVSEVQVATDMVLNSAITTAKVNDAAITADKLGSNAVTTVKISDRNVTFPKLPASVTANRVLGATTSGANYSEVQVNTDMIANGAITAEKLASGAVTISASDLADGSITANKLGSNSVTDVKIQDGAVTNSKISNRAGNSVMGRSASTAGSVADITPTVSGQVLRYDGTTTGFGTVGTEGITNGAITTEKIGDAQVTGAKILDGEITDVKISGTISASKLPVETKITKSAFKPATSGNTVSFNDIPAGVNRITINFWGISLNNTTGIDIRLKTASGVVSSGYVCSASRFSTSGVASSFHTASFMFAFANASAHHWGSATLVRRPVYGWILTGLLNSDQTQTFLSSGALQLYEELTGIDIIARADSSFDGLSGTGIQLYYE